MIGEALGAILLWILELFADLFVWLLPESWQNRLILLGCAVAASIAAWHFWPFG